MSIAASVTKQLYYKLDQVLTIVNQIENIGGSSGVRYAPLSIFFHFNAVFGKKGQIIGWHLHIRGPHPVWKILDPPLPTCKGVPTLHFTKFWKIPLADPGGRQGRAPPWGSEFFHFHAVFRQKVCKIILLWELGPPQENPRSTTEPYVIEKLLVY